MNSAGSVQRRRRMFEQKKLTVSHAPFWHNGSSVSARSYNIILATLPAVLFGFFTFGMHAVGVVTLSVSSAVAWELAFNKISKRSLSIGDGNAAMIGILFAMLLPATSPWWLVVTGTFVAMIVGKQIYGGIGGNPFNPVLVGLAILTLSWKDFFDFNEVLVNYDFSYPMAYPLASLKHFGVFAISNFKPAALLVGQQSGGIGAIFGLGLIIGGIYLIIRGCIRWEISVSFLAGVWVTALLFNMADPAKYAAPAFHLLTGYTLIGAFFLVTEDSSSPVNFIPMLIYGACAGIMTVLIRNIGAYVDGVVFAILLANLINPLVDKIRPKALGKVV